MIKTLIPYFCWKTWFSAQSVTMAFAGKKRKTVGQFHKRRIFVQQSIKRIHCP